MDQRIDAIYEDGVLRPLAPLSLTDHQRVSVTVHTPPVDDEDWVDHDFMKEAEEGADDRISLGDVRKALEKIRQPLTDAFREERDHR